MRFTAVPSITVIALCVGLLASAIAVAEERNTLEHSLRQQLRIHNQNQRRINRLAKRLDPAAKAHLVGTLSRFPDSDGDGVPDMLETGLGTNICDRDSDHDSRDDKDELDDDAVRPTKVPEEEIEATGPIAAITSTDITIDKRTYHITSSTVFRDRQGNTVSVQSFAVNDCIEIKGTRTDSSGLAASVVRKEDQKECS